MLFRIDLERYLTHMIDHFPRDILLSMQYAIVSAGIRNMGRFVNCIKINELYPSTEIVTVHSQYNDKKILSKMYYEELSELNYIIYRAFVNTVMIHHDILILCRENENEYIDVLVEYIHGTFGLECINLNDLFIKGRVGPYSLDRTLIHNKTVDMRYQYGNDMMRELESTEGGREKLLSSMTKKQKIERLESLGIIVNKSDHDELDNLLREEWVIDEPI